MMDIAMKISALSVAGVATLMIAFAPLPASACDVSSPTDISCPGANQNPANPLYSVGHPTPDTSTMFPPPAPAVDQGYAGNPYGYGGPSVLGTGGILSSLFGAEPAEPAAYPSDYAAPDEVPVLHHRHHRRHKHVE